ncbi:hypothetical protein TBLA_0D00860 [Henningerozyma blattae CBS 6284]|uniref:Ran GTPase-activating protein 1 n=1 Tax=Henningerozyma blattae (strain ATCC 34711 / CBS 6284 / DSM 70876 / NBRC 10599 / NRRL Y-10934 / UCD 77-7) TaxID=1071380 RepID=I2H2J2_HENB6|nr:hypothetical protein TBLA_0D00860 [Tetrapisispora blattae CBS 6284]CCH60594.1 hypothetical protein TBLA_0D00860 [Tetrapisispora blattae CBS 6284]
MATLHLSPTYKDAEVFSIQGKALKLTSEDDIKPILEDLSKLEIVKKIDFSGNTIGIEASKELAKFINSNDSILLNIEEINFADLYTSRLVDEVVESLTALLPVLLKCKKLTILNLSDNAFGLRTIDQLENYITHAIHLKHLLLSNNGMGPFAGERIGKALFHLAQNKESAKTPYLETFICGRNRLENGSALYLALGLKAHKDGLKVVKLYQNGIRPKGVSTLLNYGLQYNKSLEILDLQDNTFTSSASLILAKVLPIWKSTLIELNLNDCLLKTAGSDAVFKVVKENTFPNLKTLKFEYNEMSQETLENYLIPSIEGTSLPVLEHLEINGNRFEEDSEPLDVLQAKFEDLELDDLEEVDSDEDEDNEDEEEEEDEEEKMDEVDVTLLEKNLSKLNVDDLAADLANTHI